MKISKVLLRWYKSFNVNYLAYDDRRHGVESRPWNAFRINDAMESDYRFIEIPFEDDITTIVGANESGKSHLISAISKVISGKGIPEQDGNSRAFDRTDLCHFAAVRSKNAEIWPNIGVEFFGLTAEDQKSLAAASGRTDFNVERFTLIVAGKGSSEVGHVFVGTDHIELNKVKLDAVRQHLPQVKFIKSDVAIADQVTLANLLAAYGVADVAASISYDFPIAQLAAKFLSALTLSADNKQLSDDQIKSLKEVQSGLARAQLDEPSKDSLEALLFRDVLGISAETLKYLATLEKGARGYIEGLVSIWNTEIEERLHLSHYWQQDDLFSLRIDFKQGVLFFEITDKTGSIYTFRERSSGLRYFLSYYIQAKALELSIADKNAIILMDEPDSFLSIIGQRNLLAVFESLVSAESSRQNVQLIYTTHSPFLINRNYPRRLRLVRKGDAEEGTQYICQSMVRRYEPVRSALGIDCAQTLFMGATNIVMEGPTDQFLISELIRSFVSRDNVNDFLDLNSAVMVSAESAPSIEKLLVASQWGDEPIPAVVVLLDSDGAGNEVRDRITGKARHCKKLVEPEIVLQIAEVLGTAVEGQGIQTIDDLLPCGLYKKAVAQFIDRWYPSHEKRSDIDTLLAKESFGTNGVVAGTRAIFDAHIHSSPREYDKMGVLQEAVSLVVALDKDKDAVVLAEIQQRLLKLCQALRRAIALGEQAARRHSGKQAIQRVIDDFFVQHKEASSVFELELTLERLIRESELLGQDGERLKVNLGRWLSEIQKIRNEKQERVVGATWEKWRDVLRSVRENPLQVGETNAPIPVMLQALVQAPADKPAAVDGQSAKVPVKSA